MGVWDAYEARLGISEVGNPKRSSKLSRTREYLQRTLVSSLSYKDAVVDGVPQNLAILDTEEFDIKTACAMPGEKLKHGGLVEWGETVWLVTEIDQSNGVYVRGKMQRCNYRLRWIDDKGNVISRWCIVEDGTKYLIGEKSGDIMTVGDARIAVTIGKDSDTNKLVRGMRFLIDDQDSTQVLAYEITKPNKLYDVYDGEGVFRFILTEVNLTDNDNVALRIADYYSWRPKKDRIPSDVKTDDTVEEIVASAIEAGMTLPEEIERENRWI